MFVQDWIWCTTTSTGNGTLTLTKKTGWCDFSDYFAVGVDGSCDYFEYLIRDASTLIPIEAGIGHYGSAGVLTRDHVYKTLVSGTLSQANTAATLAAGTYDVLCADLASTRLRGDMQVRTAATARYLGDASYYSNTGNTKTLSAGTLYAIPFRLQSPGLISGAAAFVTTGAASSNIRIALYRLNKAREAATQICSTADIVTTASSTLVTGSWASGGDRRLPCGDYVLAVKSNGGNPTLYAGTNSCGNLPDSHFWGGSGVSTAYKYTFAQVADAGSPLTSPCPALSYQGATTDYAPRLFLVQTAL